MDLLIPILSLFNRPNPMNLAHLRADPLPKDYKISSLSCRLGPFQLAPGHIPSPLHPIPHQFLYSRISSSIRYSLTSQVHLCSSPIHSKHRVTPCSEKVCVRRSCIISIFTLLCIDIDLNSY